jgi:hypothetical protein
MLREHMLEQARALSAEALDIAEEGTNAKGSVRRQRRALVRQLEALRLTIEATLLPDIAEEDEGTWARVELFGHTVKYGLVREVEFCGRRFLEITEPALWHPDNELHDGEPDFPETSKRYHPNAVYAISDRTEEEVIRHLRSQHGLFASADPVAPSPGDDLF